MGASTRLLSSALLPLAWLASAGCPTQAIVCNLDTDCPGDQLCVDQTCRHTCNVTAECETGERCQQGYCMPGGDAAATDSAASDRGGTDRTGVDQNASDRPASDHAIADRAVPDGAIRCDDSYCSAHGECWVTGSDITCLCGAGYAQPRCAACASGYQDNDSNGTCLLDCAHANLSCAQPHTRCGDSDGTADCGCVLGYSAPAATCVWTGGPLDPGFQQNTGWTVEGHAVVDTSAAGADDPGRGHFPKEAACAGGGALVQTVQMPALADAENLALRFWLRSEGFSLSCLFAKIVVVVNGGEYSYWLPGSTWTRKSICLGARSYGGPLAIRFEVADACSTCTPSGILGGTVPTFEIDNALIEPAAAAECPDVGAILNPDFEQGPVSWTPTTSDGGSAGVASGVGAGGSWGGNLSTTKVCAQAALAGRASLPLAVDAPSFAMQLRARGGASDQLSIGLNRNTVSQLTGIGIFDPRRVCVLDAFKGLAVDVDFKLYASGATCGDPGAHAFVVDDLSLVSEPACPAGARIFDPGFENAVDAPQLAPGWNYSANYAASANAVENASVAHSGNMAAQLTVSSACGNATISSLAMVPPAESGRGPAIKLWYRAPVLGQTELWFGQTLPPTASYVQALRCLEPTQVGRLASISVYVNSASGAACGTAHTAETAWIDDVEVTTDPSCPE